MRRLVDLAWAGSVAALALFGAAPARAQAYGDSVVRAAPADTLPLPTTGPAVDSVRPDTTAPAPVASPGDSPPAAAASPADTTLKKACTGAPPGMLAPGLLAVVYRAGTTREEAIAAAKSVGGEIAGMSDLGEVYVRVPPSAGALDVVADQLIRQDPVTRVAPTPCPAPAPAGAPKPAATDSGASRPSDSTGARPAPSP
jgi:hypothetical protein